MKAVEAVDRQLDAYNARDLERFAAQYSDDVCCYRPPAIEPVLRGKTAFAAFYATQRFVHEGLRAEVLTRIILGNKVVDHERIFGVREDPFEAVIVYEVKDGLIATTWTYTSD